MTAKQGSYAAPASSTPGVGGVLKMRGMVWFSADRQRPFCIPPSFENNLI
jgi:hypothetical protein